MIVNNKEKFFSFKGRISGSTFAKRVAVFYVIILISQFISVIGEFLLVGRYGINPQEITPYRSNPLLLSLIVILCLIFIIAFIMQVVKRLHDLDKGGLEALLIFIPFFVIIYTFYLIFAVGTVGRNRYGEDPREKTPHNPQYTSNQENELKGRRYGEDPREKTLHNPHTSNQENEIKKWRDEMIVNNKEKFFSFKGRINRSTFGTRMSIFWVIMFISMCLITVGGVLLIEKYGTIFPKNTSDAGNFLLPSLIIILCLIFFIAFIMQIVKRLHDLDKGGHWALLILVPGAAFIFIVYLLFAAGTVGRNRYGEKPEEITLQNPEGITPQNPQYDSNQENETRYQWK